MGDVPQHSTIYSVFHIIFGYFRYDVVLRFMVFKYLLVLGLLREKILPVRLGSLDVVWLIGRFVIFVRLGSLDVAG